MSICIVALVVLAVMGIFSAKYRRWAKEAFSCVARRVTFRPCETGFNERVKSFVVANLLKRSQRLAQATYRHFELLSWIFTIIFFVSLILTANGLYNLYAYGTCDPSNPDTCIFTPQHPSCVNATAAHQCTPCTCGNETVGCESPDYEACGGDCECVEAICGVS